jgi:hypothetical protein
MRKQSQTKLGSLLFYIRTKIKPDLVLKIRIYLQYQNQLASGKQADFGAERILKISQLIV